MLFTLVMGWASMHLLFWLSLVPFLTRWMGESGFEPPVAVNGGVLIMVGRDV